jgi:hypothetical protein
MCGRSSEIKGPNRQARRRSGSREQGITSYVLALCPNLGIIRIDPFRLLQGKQGATLETVAEGQIVRFKIGEGFPADDQLARWMTVCAMALNDLLLVNRWLLPRLEETEPSEPYENFYLGRIAAAHLFEGAKFLRESDRIPQIQEFVASLDSEAQDDYRALVELTKDQTDKFREQLEHARNTFFHYPRMLPQAEDYEHLKRAMAGHASDEQEQRSDVARFATFPLPCSASAQFSRMTLPRR